MNPRITEQGEARRKLKLRDHALHNIKNVNYTGIRFEDGQWKLHVGVTKKLPEHDKLLNPAINFSGLPLIFDEIGEIKALAANRKIKYRPAPPGVSMGHKDITAGTFGVTCFKDGTKYILSNNHVLANMNAGEVGDHILQPGHYDGGADPADEMGTLAAFIPIVFNDQNNPNYVDSALALPTNPSDLLDEILELGYPTGSKEATVGMNVIKSGRTTGINMGTITEFSGLIEIGYGGPGSAYFDDQIVTGAMLQGGDSGSCLLDALDNKAVGLCFAASDVISIMNRMTEVIAALGITIFQPDYATATTQTATTDSGAGEITLNGYVAYIYSANPHRYFEWGTVSGTYTHTEDCGTDGVGAFSKTITADSGFYYFRAKVVDGANTNYGTERAATLASPPSPPLPPPGPFWQVIWEISDYGDPFSEYGSPYFSWLILYMSQDSVAPVTVTFAINGVTAPTCIFTYSGNTGSYHFWRWDSSLEGETWFLPLANVFTITGTITTEFGLIVLDGLGGTTMNRPSYNFRYEYVPKYSETSGYGCAGWGTFAPLPGPIIHSFPWVGRFRLTRVS